MPDSNLPPELPLYGDGDSTYRSLGELEGITRLVERFYQLMDERPEAKTLRDMHPKDLTQSAQKLTYFLSGWSGGPRLFAQHFGEISLPKAHAHFDVNDNTMGAWLDCMDQALQDLGYSETLRNYLIEKLSVPANSMKAMSEYQKSLKNNPSSGTSYEAL